MKLYIKAIVFIILIQSVVVDLSAQEITKNIEEMTREEILNIPYDELIELPLDQLLKLADIVGVSLEELYEMILNKDVVSASKKVESSFEAPLSTSVVSYDEIVSSGARTIEEALRLVPGMIVREKTNGNFDIHIRGNDNLPSNHMTLYSENSISLVMIDGRPVYNYVHGGTFWESLPIGIVDVDRIEVVRGASSALYGPNAVSGVVNIITKKQNKKELSIVGDVEGGSLSTFKTNIGIGKGLGEKFAFRVTGNYLKMERTSDLLYVYLAKGGNGGYITKQELEDLDNPSSPGYKVFDPSDDIDAMYPNPKLARESMGANAYLFFNASEDVSADVKFGFQNSDVISSTMGDNPTPFVGRLSNTGYFDINGKIKNLNLKINGVSGWQDIVRQDTGFKVDLKTINASAEHNIKLNNLEIRPGFYYQLASYDDREYINQVGDGFLNGEKQLLSSAASLRVDYRPIEKLRFIAALRGEKYNTHDDPYFSYQLLGVYSINENNLFRVGYSKANRGPFIIDSYANYLWVRDGRPDPGYIYFQGNENLNLLTMNLLEVGYRWKPVKNIQVDVEGFMTNTVNYSALYPDSVNLNIGDRPYARMTYQSIDLESKQMGVTAVLSYVATENLIIKAFGTYQKTTVYNSIPDVQDKTIQDMLVTATVAYTVSGTITSSEAFTDERIDEKTHKWTPAVFGGLTIDYKFLDKRANIFSSTYFYTSEIFEGKYGVREIDGRMIQNIKLSYNLNQSLVLFVNARNIIGKKIEFPYMDETEPVFLGGLTIKIN